MFERFGGGIVTFGIWRIDGMNGPVPGKTLVQANAQAEQEKKEDQSVKPGEDRRDNAGAF